MVKHSCDVKIKKEVRIYRCEYNPRVVLFQIVAFNIQLLQTDFKITAGVNELGASFVYTYLGTIITYIFILLQFAGFFIKL